MLRGGRALSCLVAVIVAGAGFSALAAPRLRNSQDPELVANHDGGGGHRPQDAPGCKGGESNHKVPNRPEPNTDGKVACRAEPARSSGKGKRPPPHPGDHWLGVQTNGYFGTGAYGALNVVDPSVRRGTNDYLTQRFLSKTCDSSRWIEVGWAEVGWRDNRQYIYTYSSIDHQWHFFDQYPIGPGSRVYVELYRQGDGWDAYLWWNGGWQFLWKARGYTDLTCTENYVEPNASSSGGHFPSPTIQAGDGGAGGVQIADSNGGFRAWDGGVSSTVNWDDGSGYWTTRLQQYYYSFYVDSNNHPPNVALSVSPDKGIKGETNFTADMSGTSDPDGDAISSYRIYWGDGGVTWDRRGSRVYSSTGRYTIRAEAVDEWGRSASVSRVVEVCDSITPAGRCNLKPVVRLSVSPEQGDTNTTFTADMSSTYDPDGDALTYEIDWGDGNLTAARRAQHVYSSPGDYVINVKATDAYGVSNTAERAIRVCEVYAEGQCAQSEAARGEAEEAGSVGEEALAGVWSKSPGAPPQGYHSERVASSSYQAGTGRFIDEATLPRGLPAAPPVRGCATFGEHDTSEAIKFVYVWNEEHGNRYEQHVEELARIIDRIDWALDASSKFDQHFRFNCRYQPDGTYGSYARALITPEQVSNDVDRQEGEGPAASTMRVRGEMAAKQGPDGSSPYARRDRWYVYITDFPSGSDAFLCPESRYDAEVGSDSDQLCTAVAEGWSASLIGHELIHTLGAGHSWAGQFNVNGLFNCNDDNVDTYCPHGKHDEDIMGVWQKWWQVDNGFNTYYDPEHEHPSNLSRFYIDPFPSEFRWNISDSPVLTAPRCCDGGYNDLLTVQNRTVEDGTTSGFTPVSSTLRSNSNYFFDGRHSLRIRTDGTAAHEGVALQTYNVTAGRSYKASVAVRLREYLTTGRTAQIVLRWFNSNWGTISTSRRQAFPVVGDQWRRWDFTAVAPTGARRVEIRVETPKRQARMVFFADAFQLEDQYVVGGQV